MIDPVQRLEHAHGSLTKLALDVRQLLHTEGRISTKSRQRLVAKLAQLQHELFEHFANEEEGLFPFLREHAPEHGDVVDRLESAHDAICGAIVRLARLVEAEGTPLSQRAARLAVYERFEAAYTAHAQAEAKLFEQIDRTLRGREREALAEILRGL